MNENNEIGEDEQQICNLFFLITKHCFVYQAT